MLKHMQWIKHTVTILYTTMWTKASVVTKSNNANDVASKTWSKWH